MFTPLILKNTIGISVVKTWTISRDEYGHFCIPGLYDWQTVGCTCTILLMVLSFVSQKTLFLRARIGAWNFKTTLVNFRSMQCAKCTLTKWICKINLQIIMDSFSLSFWLDYCTLFLYWLSMCLELYWKVVVLYTRRTRMCGFWKSYEIGSLKMYEPLHLQINPPSFTVLSLQISCKCMLEQDHWTHCRKFSFGCMNFIVHAFLFKEASQLMNKYKSTEFCSWVVLKRIMFKLKTNRSEAYRYNHMTFSIWLIEWKQ